MVSCQRDEGSARVVANAALEIETALVGKMLCEAYVSLSLLVPR